MITVLIIVGFASCKDAQEPETLGYVVAIGIDMPKEEEKGYNFTVQFANPDKISGGSAESGGKGGEESLENITVLAPSIYSAINIANHIISKKFILSHTKLIVFSDEVAKGGVGKLLEALSRNSDIRPNIYFAVCKGEAQEFLEAVNPKSEVNPVRYYTMIFENDYSGFIPQNISLDFYLFYDSDEKSAVMPICAVAKEDAPPEYDDSGYQYGVEDYIAGDITTQNSQVQIAGMAVFNGDTKISEIRDIKTEIFNMLTGEYQSSYVSYYTDKTPEVPVAIEQISKKKPRIRVKTEADVPEIDITVYLEANLLSGDINVSGEEAISDFSRQAAAEVKRNIIEFIGKTQELGTDIVGFGSYAKRNFATIQGFSEYNWKEKYKNARIKVNVEFSVKRSGVIVRREK